MSGLNATERALVRMSALVVLDEVGQADNALATAIAAHVGKTVDTIATDRVRAALTEAAERLTNAHGDLFRLAQGAVDADNERRLFGKCEGVRLAKSYLDDAVRNLSPDG